MFMTCDSDDGQSFQPRLAEPYQPLLHIMRNFFSRCVGRKFLFEVKFGSVDAIDRVLQICDEIPALALCDQVPSMVVTCSELLS